MGSSFKRSSKYPSRWILFGRFFFGLRTWFRRVRITKPLTQIFGPQYKRSRKLIEIDITYLCNLHCINCNRSVSQAPEAKHMTMERIKDFVNETIERKYMWERIRVLGGEPTLHPQFHEIIEQLLYLNKWNPNCRIEVVTNGYGKDVQEALDKLPPIVWIENSKKSGKLQETFGPFNLAPCDDPRFNRADYRNGCAIMEECGMGLTPLGYYPCAIAGGIDRITNWRIGYEAIPDSKDDMVDTTKQFCALCGRFRDGHFIPKNLRPRLIESKVSLTWVRLYEEWICRTTNS